MDSFLAVQDLIGRSADEFFQQFKCECEEGTSFFFGGGSGQCGSWPLRKKALEVVFSQVSHMPWPLMGWQGRTREEGELGTNGGQVKVELVLGALFEVLESWRHKELHPGTDSGVLRV